MKTPRQIKPFFSDAKPRSISVADSDWQKFCDTAKALGISRSELFRRIWLNWIS